MGNSTSVIPDTTQWSAVHLTPAVHWFLWKYCSRKIPVFFPIFTFPQTTSLSNTKKSSDARTNLFLSALRNIPRSHGGIAYPPNPRRSFGRNIQREMPGVPYIRAGAYAPLHDFTASRKIALKRRVASLIYGRLRGTFPLGLPECIRQTALPSVRGPDRAPRLRRGAVGQQHYALEFCSPCSLFPGTKNPRQLLFPGIHKSRGEINPV